MIRLPEPPRLTRPAVAVRTSYLVGEQADCVVSGAPADWLGPASEDFASHVAERRAVRTRWGVPSSVFWYVSGEYYLGTLDRQLPIPPPPPRRLIRQGRP